MSSHPCVWHLQLGLSGGLDSDDRLLPEAGDGADVLVRHVAQCAGLGVKGNNGRKHTFASGHRRRPERMNINGVDVKDISDCLYVR